MYIKLFTKKYSARSKCYIKKNEFKYAFNLNYKK